MLEERVIKERIDEYYGRTLQMKPLILADQNMLGRFKSVVNYQYFGKGLDKDVIFLGEGSSNKVYNIGSVIDSANQKEIPIGVRLNKEIPFLIDIVPRQLKMIKEELMEYEAAYAVGENVPYFVGVIKFPYGSSEGCAIITEDISNRGLYTLKSIGEDPSKNPSHVERTKDGLTEKFFIDPHKFMGLEYIGLKMMETIKKVCDGEKYLKENAIINL